MNAAVQARPDLGGVEVMSVVCARVSLATLLQVVDMEAVTGWVDVGAHGGVLVSDGLPVDAWLGRWTATDALYELFLVDEAERCVVWEADVAGDRRPLGPTSSLVLEGARRADEWRRIAGMVLSRAPGSTLATVPARCEPIVERLDGKTPLFQVVDATGVPRHIASHGLAPLVAAGVLVASGEVVPLPVATRSVGVTGSAPAEGPDFFDCLERGRSELRSGDLASAHRWFTHAVELRPEDRVAAQNQRRVARLLEERT